jgi:hypothetical protein
MTQKEHMAKYRKANRDKIRAQQKQYYELNKERINAKHRVYYASNKTRLKISRYEREIRKTA